MSEVRSKRSEVRTKTGGVAAYEIFRGEQRIGEVEAESATAAMAKARELWGKRCTGAVLKSDE